LGPGCSFPERWLHTIEQWLLSKKLISHCCAGAISLYLERQRSQRWTRFPHEERIVYGSLGRALVFALGSDNRPSLLSFDIIAPIAALKRLREAFVAALLLQMLYFGITAAAIGLLNSEG
jgi:hypothetical protein